MFRFYTLMVFSTPQLVKKVGFVDINSFSFRGMGHVDCTIRCARARFTSETAPWDVIDSNSFISTTKQEYKSILLATPIHVYDAFNRERKYNSSKNRI